jgi:hypothetical protein
MAWMSARLVCMPSSTTTPRPMSRPAVCARSTLGADADGDNDEIGFEHAAVRAPPLRRLHAAIGAVSAFEMNGDAARFDGAA